MPLNKREFLLRRNLDFHLYPSLKAEWPNHLRSAWPHPTTSVPPSFRKAITDSDFLFLYPPPSSLIKVPLLTTFSEFGIDCLLLLGNATLFSCWAISISSFYFYFVELPSGFIEWTSLVFLDFLEVCSFLSK